MSFPEYIYPSGVANRKLGSQRWVLDPDTGVTGNPNRRLQEMTPNGWRDVELTGVTAGGGSGGTITSVNGDVGPAVLLNQDEIPDGTTAKQYIVADKNKLAGIAPLATANSPDNYLLSRSNHTDTQLASTISDFAAATLSNLTATPAETLNAAIKHSTRRELIVGPGLLTDARVPLATRLASIVSDNAYIKFVGQFKGFGTVNSTTARTFVIDLQNKVGWVFDFTEAYITVEGGFTQTAVGHSTMGGIRLINCQNCHIIGGEFNGACDTVNRGTITNEGSNNTPCGIYLSGCKNTTVQNVYTHHWMNDGILAFYRTNTLGDVLINPVQPSFNLAFINCRSTFNARQALSSVNVVNLLCISCDFDYTGQSSYGGHAPQAGVDVEPDYGYGREAPQFWPTDSDSAAFVSCNFRNSKGGQFISAYPENVNALVHINSRLISPAGADVQTLQVGGGAFTTTWQNCLYDMRATTVQVHFNPLAAYTNGASNFQTVYNVTRIIGGLLYAPGIGLIMLDDYPIEIDGLVCIKTGASNVAPLVRNARAKFRNCNFGFEAAAAPNAGSNYASVLCGDIENCGFWTLDTLANDRQIVMWYQPWTESQMSNLTNCWFRGRIEPQGGLGGAMPGERKYSWNTGLTSQKPQAAVWVGGPWRPSDVSAWIIPAPDRSGWQKLSDGTTVA